jgi:hypothetical protein
VLADLLPEHVGVGFSPRSIESWEQHIIGCHEVVIGEGFLRPSLYVLKKEAIFSANPMLFALSPIFYKKSPKTGSSTLCFVSCPITLI